MPITLRSEKGSALTHEELDDNFVTLAEAEAALETTGWGYYKDNAGGQTITITPSRMSIDGLGATTEEDYLPQVIRGTGHLWDTAADRITPIAIGDAYTLRLDLTVTSETSNPTNLEIELDIQAGTVYGNAIIIVDRIASTGRSVPYTISVGFPVFVGATFAVNGAQVWLTTDTGSVTITNPAITLVRIHGEPVA